MLSIAADKTIWYYQRYISPYKGFCCAYYAHTGQPSCSAYARIIVRRLGVFALFSAMPRQFARCKASYMAILEARKTTKPSSRQKKKNNWCDGFDCSGCDLGSCNTNYCHLPRKLIGDCHHCDAPYDCDVGACDCSL